MPRQFTLTEQHIKLLQCSYVDWNDACTGAAAIDPKRPYGNSGYSQIAKDIAEILEIEIKEDEEMGVDRDQQAELLELHRETSTALQVILSCGKFEPGVYECSDAYGSPGTWTLLTVTRPEPEASNLPPDVWDRAWDLKNEYDRTCHTLRQSVYFFARHLAPQDPCTPEVHKAIEDVWRAVGKLTNEAMPAHMREFLKGD